MRNFTEQDVVDALRQECQKSSQSAWAFDHGFSPAFVSDVLKGRRDVTEKLAAALGYRRLIVFEKVKKEEK